MPTALVTGASRGIGRAIAERFGRDGLDVVVNYRKSESAANSTVNTIRSSGVKTAAIQADVSQPAEVDYLIQETLERFGGIDHVVNNAGINQHVNTMELSISDFDNMTNVNLRSVFTVTKAALEPLQKSEMDTPSILNLTSILAFSGAPHECHYAATKAGIMGLTRSHAQEFAPDIRVNAIAPGFIRTDMTDYLDPKEEDQRKAAIPLHRFGRPEDVAETAAFLRDARFVTGEVIHVNGGELIR